MTKKKVKAAIKGSIANPEAAKAVIDSLEATADLGDLAELDAAAPVADVESADAPAAASEYTQADIQDIVDVANECKTQLNALLASLRAAGILTEEEA